MRWKKIDDTGDWILTRAEMFKLLELLEDDKPNAEIKMKYKEKILDENKLKQTLQISQFPVKIEIDVKGYDKYVEPITLTVTGNTVELLKKIYSNNKIFNILSHVFVDPAGILIGERNGEYSMSCTALDEFMFEYNGRRQYNYCCIPPECLETPKCNNAKACLYVMDKLKKLQELLKQKSV